MKQIISLALAMLWSISAWALQPYIYADKVSGATTDAKMAAVEQKLVKAGFSVIGKYTPAGLSGAGVMVATDPELNALIAGLGGSTIVAAPIRIGVSNDGVISYINPDYWYRAFLRKHFIGNAGRVAQNVKQRLAKALGDKGEFGGDVDKRDLPDYQYMFGMESFESEKNLVGESLSFDDMVQTVRANLKKGVGHTAKVYEVVIPEKKIAVFGVAMNDPKEGEAWWVKLVDDRHLAALPYELYVIDNKAYHLFARYRIALSWPDTGMGTFMRIVEAPQIIMDTMSKVASNKRY
jgi:hypothetical protein